jgi:hypothetical protein
VNERGYFGDIGVNGRIILKYILEKYDVILRTGSKKHMTGPIGGFSRT